MPARVSENTVRIVAMNETRSVKTRKCGCKAFARTSKQFKTGKVANKEQMGLMVGFAGGAGYNLYVPETKKIIVTRDIHMMEYSADVHCTPEQPDHLYMD